MRETRHGNHGDTDSLQADVMRFMAIIAFCLIAMLALVRNLDNPAPEAAKRSTDSSSRALSSRDASPTERASASTKTESVPIEPSISGAAKRRNTLTLRFASDRDFLGLVAAGDVDLFGSTAEGLLRLNDDFTISSGEPKGEFYEVMADSVPVKIARIFERSHASPKYFVSLPDQTRRELARFLVRLDAERATGALIIHRDGHISHER